MTVVRAKALRLKSVDEHTNEAKQEETVQETVAQPIEESTNFTLPDNAKKIDEIVTIIQTHKGNTEIVIGNKNVSVNEE